MFISFLLGGFCPGGFGKGVFCPGVYVWGFLSGGFCPDTLTYIPHLDGAFIPSSLMEKSRIPLRNMEERIAFANFVST